MATVTLSLHSKQPKRTTISFDKAYIEILNIQEACRCHYLYTDDGHKEIIDAGDTNDALFYEITDMEKAVNLSDPKED